MRAKILDTPKSPSNHLSIGNELANSNSAIWPAGGSSFPFTKDKNRAGAKDKGGARSNSRTYRDGNLQVVLMAVDSVQRGHGQRGKSMTLGASLSRQPPSPSYANKKPGSFNNKKQLKQSKNTENGGQKLIHGDIKRRNTNLEAKIPLARAVSKGNKPNTASRDKTNRGSWVVGDKMILKPEPSSNSKTYSKRNGGMKTGLHGSAILESNITTQYPVNIDELASRLKSPFEPFEKTLKHKHRISIERGEEILSKGSRSRLSTPSNNHVFVKQNTAEPKSRDMKEYILGSNENSPVNYQKSKIIRLDTKLSWVNASENNQQTYIKNNQKIMKQREVFKVEMPKKSQKEKREILSHSLEPLDRYRSKEQTPDRYTAKKPSKQTLMKSSVREKLLESVSKLQDHMFKSVQWNDDLQLLAEMANENANLRMKIKKQSLINICRCIKRSHDRHTMLSFHSIYHF